MINIQTLESVESINKTILITGANSGIGFEASKFLAKRGAKVIMAVRSLKKGEDAKNIILADTANENVFVKYLDLEDLETVKNFVKVLEVEKIKIDVLINNAGIMMPKQGKTKDGFERQIGINHLGHFALTGLIKPLLNKGARVINVSSQAHLMGKLNLEDIHLTSNYKPFKAYAQSKLANALFTESLKEKLDDIIPITVHPGVAKTSLFGKTGSTLGFKLISPLFNLMASSAYKGSLPLVAAAITSDIKPGAYIGPKGKKGQLSLKDKVNPLVYDKTLQEGLWKLSETLTNVTY